MYPIYLPHIQCESEKPFRAKINQSCKSIYCNSISFELEIIQFRISCPLKYIYIYIKV